MATKNLTCPFCRNKRPFSHYLNKAQTGGQMQPRVAVSNDQRQQLFQAAKKAQPAARPQRQATQYVAPSANGVVSGRASQPWTISVPSLGASYPLAQGRNVVGRQAPDSQATIQIPCTTTHMSREHLNVDVEPGPGGMMVHSVSLTKATVNPTTLNGQPLAYGARVVVNPGDVVRLSDVDIVFM